MGKLKKVISRIPLMPALIIVMSFFIIVAVILSKTTTSYANEQMQLIQAKYIVFDEPTAMLDPQGRREVMETMQRLNREEGLTIVNITHFMEEAVLL